MTQTQVSLALKLLFLVSAQQKHPKLTDFWARRSISWGGRLNVLIF